MERFWSSSSSRSSDRREAAKAQSVQQHLMGLQHAQQQRALLRINAVADSCFRECITDFALTKHLRPTEEQCLQFCVDKYVLLLRTGGLAYASTLEGA